RSAKKAAPIMFHFVRHSSLLKDLRTGSPLPVRRKNVIFCRHSRMAHETAIDGACRTGREFVGRGVIVKRGVCPSLRVGESLAILLDEKNVLQVVRYPH